MQIRARATLIPGVYAYTKLSNFAEVDKQLESVWPPKQRVYEIQPVEGLFISQLGRRVINAFFYMPMIATGLYMMKYHNWRLPQMTVNTDHATCYINEPGMRTILCARSNIAEGSWVIFSEDNLVRWFDETIVATLVNYRRTDLAPSSNLFQPGIDLRIGNRAMDIWTEFMTEAPLLDLTDAPGYALTIHGSAENRLGRDTRQHTLQPNGTLLDAMLVHGTELTMQSLLDLLDSSSGYSRLGDEFYDVATSGVFPRGQVLSEVVSTMNYLGASNFDISMPIADFVHNVGKMPDPSIRREPAARNAHVGFDFTF